MTTCMSCGNDVTGKKFCQHCGTPVQSTGISAINISATTCPHCGGDVNANAAFCMHCGSALHAAQPVIPPMQARPATRPCPVCHQEVPMDTAFCIHCGQNMNASATTSHPLAAPVFCNTCGKQNTPDMRFCGGCGSPLTVAQPAQSGANYEQPGQYPSQQPYGQQQVQSGQYPQQQPYGQPQYQQYQQPQYPQQYNQGGYQQQPMMGQQPMTLRCPVCMAIAPVGTQSCPGCRTNLAGVVPTPVNMPTQGQQGMFEGGVGNFLQGNNGKMAMGALGGVAAVIGGEMLLHGVENSIEGRVEGDVGYDGYEHRHHHRREEEGLLGGLGDIANDVGLF